MRLDYLPSITGFPPNLTGWISPGSTQGLHYQSACIVLETHTMGLLCGILYRFKLQCSSLA